jgi:hypothetical protein
MHYRLYFYDRAGHIEFVHEFEAVADAPAISVSEGWREGRRIELWQGRRFMKGWS